MGRKRKRESSEERMRRKIREYKNRLAKKSRRHDSVHSDENNDVIEVNEASPYYNGEDDGEYQEPYSQELLTDNNLAQARDIPSFDDVTAAIAAATMPADSVQPPPGAGVTPAVAADGVVPGIAVAPPASDTASSTTPAARPTLLCDAQETITAATAAANEPALDDLLLSLLGDAPKPEVELGPPIHRDISLRWQEILSKGLKSDIKSELTDEYVIPQNLDRLIPPTLNPEILSALATTPAPVKRDFALQQRQKLIGTALAALSRTLNALVADKSLTAPGLVIKPLSDGCRLLCELFYRETCTRRSFIISSINSQMKEPLLESVPGKFLFGENLADRLKTAQNITRTNNILQPQNRPTFPRSNHLNTRTPYRRPAAAAASRPETGRSQTGPRTFLPPAQAHPSGAGAGARAYRPAQAPQARRRSPRPQAAAQPRLYRRPPPPPLQRRR